MAYSHDEVAHNWAHQTGRKQRGFNMFYEGDTIYSYGYHFPIAKHVVTPNGSRVVLLNRGRYSISTTNHQQIVARSVDRSVLIGVSEVPAHGDFTRPMARDELRRIKHEMEATAVKWKRARTRKYCHYDDLRAHIERFGAINEMWELGEDPMTMPDDIAAYAADYERRLMRERKDRDAKEREAIRDWVSGIAIHPPHTRIPYVRVKGDVVETSWGVEVPLKRALALYHLARHCRKCRHAFTPRRRHSVGGFMLDRVNSDGTIRAGCHIIPFRVSEQAAKLAGLARV